jgi:hypothetical protein
MDEPVRLGVQAPVSVDFATPFHHGPKGNRLQVETEASGGFFLSMISPERHHPTLR